MSVPERTQRQTSWALSVFEAWCEARDESDLPIDLLQIGMVEMEEKLSRFIMEVRWQDGETYPSKTVYGIVADMQRYFRGNGRHANLFLNAFDPTFTCPQQMLNARMKALIAVGVGTLRYTYHCYSI